MNTALLIVPSLAAATELPRRLASLGRPLAGLYPLRMIDLARALAEPALLGSGLLTWDSGHDALLAAHLLVQGHSLPLGANVPPSAVAAPLARTLGALRLAEVPPARLQALARTAATPEDEARLRALADLLGRWQERVEGRFADRLTLFRAARDQLRGARWLDGAEALVAGMPELNGAEQELLAALARRIVVRVTEDVRPRGLVPGSFGEWAAVHELARVEPADSLLAAIEGAPVPAGLQRLREQLFEPPGGKPVADGAVELLTAPGESAEVRAVARRLLAAAAGGVPFEEMGIALAQPQTYAPLFADLFARLGIPHKLHPSLPLRFGRSARALLLLFRCRGLERAAVMEFLTFAPVPFADMLGALDAARPAQWDAISRDARIVSGFERWMIGLRAHAEEERSAAAREASEPRRQQRVQRAQDAETLLHVVELLNLTLDALAGEESWPEWSERLQQVVGQWIAPEPDREAVLDVVADLAALGAIEARVPWHEVEHVLESRFEWERLPLPPVTRGAVHVGALDAIAGLRFRLLAIPGLVEGGFPGVLRPDPLLLDPEREALAQAPASALKPTPRREAQRRQLSLFDSEAAERGPGPAAARRPLPTTQDLLLEARRLFHRALSQASERLLLSYPRADPRSGRERLPSLFFVAAAQALAARPLGAADLERLTREDDLGALPLDVTLDRAERDRVRVRQGGRDAALQVAAGSRFFRQSHLASSARWSNELTPHDGLIAFPAREGADPELARRLRERLDPLNATWPVSASRLAAYSRCGFQYFLEHVLHLEPALEPEERKRLEPLERGSLFHDVAELFLRELRDGGLLPVRDDDETRTRLMQLADAALDRRVAGSPPRFTLLWERERRRFQETLLMFLKREADAAERSTPAYFEVGFGPVRGAEHGAAAGAEGGGRAGARGSDGGKATASEGAGAKAATAEPARSDADEEARGRAAPAARGTAAAGMGSAAAEAAPGSDPYMQEPLEIDLGDGRSLRVMGRIDRIDARADGSLVLRDYKTGRAPKDEGGVFRGGKHLQIPFYVLAAGKLFPGRPVVEAFLDYVDGGRQVALDLAAIRRPEFALLLRGLVDQIASGVFLQEPSACDFCDFTSVCGPKALIARRRALKLKDPRVQLALRLRSL